MKNIIFFFLVGCSSFSVPKAFEDRITSENLNQCLDYRNNVLSKAVVVENNKMRFIKDIPWVKESFYQFKNENIIRSIHSKAAHHLIKNCNEENIKSFIEIAKQAQHCELSFYELNYFQALAQGIKKNSWPIDVKLEGKKLAIDYVKYFSEDGHMLLDRLIAFSVLYELSLNDIIDYRIAEEAKTNLFNIQTQLIHLNEKTKGARELSCENLDVLKEELELSVQSQVELKNILKTL